ncbi:MAG: O-acetyl-ADP-ribose deacetylase [Candidatus Obscuribacter phosphatis]|uniref:O-acetyl-ADP-ribose deacetylase n=1 Tax=Candidatus Obscuribacter phosphatis TaxID=1906157 RepID=A0A8J7TL84_9BACT|nr:O-acetyl-ADP-ribose deacetylase [Candidatus Obscuribacter phosphatis]
MSNLSNLSNLELNGRKIALKRGDITREEVDAIVNAANSSLLGGGGVDGAIHKAGGPEILRQCKEIRARQGGCSPGQAVITAGGNLKAAYVIHTVGPIWRCGTGNEAETLASAYRNSLALAAEFDLKSISFPSISTGAYGYPLEQAAEIATNTVKEYCRKERGSIEAIYFVLFDQFTYDAYKQVLQS